MHDECITIPLTKGQTAIVSPEDAHIANWNWSVCTNLNYACRNRQISDGPGPSKIYMHRQILNAPKGVNVDHINHDTLDNRRCNIRHSNQSQNMANGGMWKHNKSGYRGAFWLKRERKWLAKIKVKQVQRNIGYFDTAEEAARAYDQAAREVWGEFAFQNFP